MKITKLLPAVALLGLTVAAPMTAFADTGTATTAPKAPVTSSNGLFVSGDVVLGGVCQVDAQYTAGDMMVFRAQVLESNGATINPKTTTVTATFADGTTVNMQYHGDFWVGTYVITPATPLGFLPYTVTAKDASGNTGTFVPLGIPPMIVGKTITISVNKTPVATLPKADAVDASVPLYPIIQLLKAEGAQVKWDGHVLSLGLPIAAADLPESSGTGNDSIVINGKTVLKLDGHVVKDPATHQNTTYVSTSVFGFLGNMPGASFDGSTLNIDTQAAVAGASSSK